MRWFRSARFGMFIHWGLYSEWGRGEWVMYREKIPQKEYNRLAGRFNPKRFDADAWASLAKRAGMKYMVLTTRHHDGFSLFDSAVDDFTSVKTAAGRDFIREYAAACRRHGLKVGFYYSLLNWQCPGFYAGPYRDPKGFADMVRRTHEQVRELMTNYGPVDLLWYDGAPVPGLDLGLLHRYWRAKELNAMVRSLQPRIVINDRSGLPEDYDTPEQHVTPPSGGRMWEACMTIGSGWGYIRNDAKIKPVSELLRFLVKAARYGGNLLLNVGPRADGTVQPEFVERLETMGAWLAANGSAVYDSVRCPFTEADHLLGPATARGKTVYVHLFERPAATAAAAGLPAAGVSAKVLPSGRLAVGNCGDGRVLLAGLPTASADVPPVVAIGAGRDAGGLRAPTVLRRPEIGHYDPDPAPLLDAAALVALPPGKRTGAVVKGSTFCPGWSAGVLAAPDGRLAAALAVPFDGRYALSLGIVGAKAGPVAVSLDGRRVREPLVLRTAGYPDTAVVSPLVLKRGTVRLSIAFPAGAPAGLYGLMLEPIRRPLPAPLWTAIGPFPTAFNPQTPVSEVKKALAAVHPPERVFDPAARYAGTDGLPVAWRGAKRPRSPEEKRGVNFMLRFGAKRSGVFYARTEIVCPSAREAELLIGCDWWANAFLNGKPVRGARDRKAVAEDGAEFNTCKPTPATIRLKKGVNILLVKCHRGGNSTLFTCFMADPGDLTVRAPRLD